MNYINLKNQLITFHYTTSPFFSSPTRFPQNYIFTSKIPMFSLYKVKNKENTILGHLSNPSSKPEPIPLLNTKLFSIFLVGFNAFVILRRRRIARLPNQSQQLLQFHNLQHSRIEKLLLFRGLRFYP